MRSLMPSKPLSRQTIIIIAPVLVFALGEFCLERLLYPDINQLVNACLSCNSKPQYSTKYILVATFFLALLIAAIVIWRSISQLIHMKKAGCWIIVYMNLSLLGCVLFWTHESSLDNYIKMIPDCLALSQDHVNVMLDFINSSFIAASLGIVMSAATLANRTDAKEVVECLFQLRTILMQGLSIFIAGMTFMHFWMKYAIEVGAPRQMKKEIMDLAIGIQFYHAIFFLSIVLVLAILTHGFLRMDYKTALRQCKRKTKNRLNRKWTSTAFYYREFITAVGLFIPPLLGIIETQ